MQAVSPLAVRPNEQRRESPFHARYWSPGGWKPDTESNRSGWHRMTTEYRRGLHQHVESIDRRDDTERFAVSTSAIEICRHKCGVHRHGLARDASRAESGWMGDMVFT